MPWAPHGFPTSGSLHAASMNSNILKSGQIRFPGSSIYELLCSEKMYCGQSYIVCLIQSNAGYSG
ncbi:unnamed protein product [Ixodes pacificus]